MASTTTWMRLEPRVRNADMNTGLQARIYDPLWLLARQWQFGEFQGEDNGSPAAARWRGEVSRLNRYYAGAMNGVVEGQRFNGDSMPLETIVERERARPNPSDLEKLRFAAEAGTNSLGCAILSSASNLSPSAVCGPRPSHAQAAACSACRAIA